MRVIKSILFITALTTALCVSTGCSDNSTGTNNGSSDSVTVNFVNYIPKKICLYVDNKLNSTWWQNEYGAFKVLKNSALKARAYDTIDTHHGFPIIYDTFNLVYRTFDTLHCSNYDTVAKSGMLWNIGPTDY